jgi:hypothetical protein
VYKPVLREDSIAAQGPIESATQAATNSLRGDRILLVLLIEQRASFMAKG